MLGEDVREERTGEAGRTLLPLIRSLSERGDREALVAMLKEGAERWSYAGLAGYARRLASGLGEEGVSKGDHVAIFAGGSPAWVAACLAVISRGAVVIPLDAQLGEEALEGILADCGAKLVFTAKPQVEKLERAGDAPRLVLLDAGEDDERSWLRLLSDGAVEVPEVGPGDPVALFYTSGTTGTPKGVPLTHGNLEFQTSTLLAADLLKDSDRILLPLPLHHVYPFVIGMLTPLSAGLPIVLPRSLTGPQLVRALREGEVSLIVGVPRLYAALFSGIEERAKGSRITARLFEKAMGLSTNLRRRTGLNAGSIIMGPLRRRIGPNLRVLASGGAPLDPELAGKLEAMGWRVAIGYGLTETSPIISLKLPGGGKLASVGRPVPGTGVRVDPAAMPDEEDGAGRAERPNEEGEILARGPGVFSGYRNRPEETEKVLTEDGWFRTGDLGYFDDDGYLYVTGRASTLIVTEGGKNVQPEPVEEAYTRSPAIAEIGVLQKDGRLVAVIVPETNQADADDLQGAVRAAVKEGSRRLPSYQRISDYAVTREPLEYTQLGKLRRHLLPERYDRVKGGDEGSEAAPGPVPVEDMSAGDREILEDGSARRVWDLLANRYADKPLSPDTSPQLDLGVDSLGWVNLTMEIGERTGVELGEEAISRIDTVRDLLREVTEAAGEGEAGDGTRRVSPLEHPEEALSDEQKRYLEPLSPAQSVAARALFSLDRTLMKSFFGLEVEGAEGLPKEGPFVVAPNHLSYLDSFVVAAALDRKALRRTHWAGWTGAAFGNPLTRAVSRLAQAFPVDPERAGASSLAFGAMALKQGKGLVWFPEGQRSANGELQPFKPGIGMLLDRYRVPVVPVSIRGSYEAMPPGKAFPRPGRITVTFGEPLDPDDLEREGDGEEPRDRILSALRERVAKLGAEPNRPPRRQRDDAGGEA